MSAAIASFTPTLPWAINPVEQQRARRIAATAAILFLILSALFAIFEPPPVDRAEAEKVPPRLAKLVLEKKEPPPKPEPVVEKPKEEPKPEVKEEAPKEEAPKVKPTEQQVTKAREKASKSGLLAMKDQLAALRELSASSLKQPQTKVGSEGTEARVERDLIGLKATSGSGGVATAAVSHGGGGSLAGRATTQVEAPAGTGGGLAEVRAKARSPKRTAEEIKLAFDANKSAIYGLYRRALRQNPLLEGRVVVKLTVEPDGSVSACSIVSSALSDPDLESKLVARIQLIDFGARKGVETWTGSYHIDFVPTG